MLNIVVKKVSNFIDLETLSRNNTVYSDKPEQKIREEAFFKDIIKDARKNRTVLYGLYLDEVKIIGIITLSASRLALKPALMIDYIFVVKEYRKKQINNYTCAELLMSMAFEKGLQLQQEIGISNIIFYPDNGDSKLIKYYKNSYGFVEIRKSIINGNRVENEKWLFIALKI